MTTKTKTRIRFGRLLKLAKFLDSLPPKKFDFGTVCERSSEKGCGAIGCAIGWTPNVFPQLIDRTRYYFNVVDGGRDFDYQLALKGRSGHDGYITIAMTLFGLGDDEASRLFSPSMRIQPWNTKATDNDATAKDVAESIRNFVKYSKSAV